jgi:tetratricopeptide (TPR) repeat protein
MADIEKENYNAGPADRAATQVTDLLEGVAEMVTTYHCEYHPHRAATAICEPCGADVCSECSHIRNDRLICRRCMGSLDKAFAGTGAVSPFARALTHPIVVLLVIAALLGIALARLGSSHRLGLLGRDTANVAEVEKLFQLKALLFTRKAARLEARGDSLHEMGRHREAAEAFHRAKAVHESMIDITDDRWERPLIMLARARLLEKLGEEAQAGSLYKSVLSLNAQGKTYPAIARFHLGKIQEKDKPEKALKTYGKVASDISLVPDHIISAIHLTAGSDEPYDYETRLHTFTGTDINFYDLEAEAQLRMGLTLLGLGREEEADYRFGRAVAKAADPQLGKWAGAEARKLDALRTSREGDAEPSIDREEPEKFVITHF